MYVTTSASISSIFMALWIRGTADGNDTKIYTVSGNYTTDAGSSWVERTSAIETAIGHAITTGGVELAIPLGSYLTGTGWSGIKVSYNGAANIETKVYIDTLR